MTVKIEMMTIEGYDVKIFTDNIEDNAIEHVKTLLSIDVFADKKIRIIHHLQNGAMSYINPA